jgi:UDP-N-acetylmuramoyl-tripeptide--D-alanyl-D-alanine ligase
MGTGGQKAVVTPGLVELGPSQPSENRDFAAEVARVADHLVIVGRTNRAALLEGSAAGTASVTVVGSRQEAVDWVRAHLGGGDAVLYENDLPDHYP